MSAVWLRGRRAGAELFVVAVAMAGPVAFSIWPRVREVLAAEAPASHPGLPLLILLVACLIVMCCTAKAVAKAETWQERTSYRLIYLGLALFCTSRSLEPAAALREAAAAPGKELAGRISNLTSRITAARTSRNGLPQFTFTTAEMVAAAKDAWDRAAEIRANECSPAKGGAGRKCDADKATERAALEAHSDMLRHKALTDKAQKLDDEIARLELEKAGITAPEHADLYAVKLAKIAGLFVDLGKTPVETVAEWEPVALALFIEFLPLWLSSLLRRAFGLAGSPEPAPARSWSWPKLPAWRRRQAPVPVAAPVAAAVSAPAPVPQPTPVPAPEMPAARPAAALETTAGSGLPHVAAKAPATPAKPKKINKFRVPQVREVGDVREWYAACCVARAGNRIRCKEQVYSPYRQWCEGRGKEPENFARFNEIVKGIEGIASEYDDKGKRGYFVGFAVVGSGLRLVASNSRVA